MMRVTVITGSAPFAPSRRPSCFNGHNRIAKASADALRATAASHTRLSKTNEPIAPLLLLAVFDPALGDGLLVDVFDPEVDPMLDGVADDATDDGESVVLLKVLPTVAGVEEGVADVAGVDSVEQLQSEVAS